MAPGVLSELEGLKPTIFTVSTIFCTFQSSKIAQKFELRDPTGALYNSQGSTAIMDHVAKHFHQLSVKSEEAKAKGLPTVDNPFVLGYGISQDIKKLEDIDKKLSRASTPRYFVPNWFGLAASNDPSALTFGLLTYRDREEDKRKIRPEDTNAGKPDVNYFNTVRVPVNAHDGLMIVSKGIFFDLFVKQTLVNALWSRPKTAYSGFWDELGMQNLNLNDGGNPQETSTSTTYRRTLTWESDNQSRYVIHSSFWSSLCDPKFTD
jgi:hypothetical protein